MNIKNKPLLVLLLLILLCAVTLTGCANLKNSAALVQHAVGGIYDPTKQMVNNQLTVILNAVTSQDAAAVKAQFAPNAIAVQPELDSQIEALFDLSLIHI